MRIAVYANGLLYHIAQDWQEAHRVGKELHYTQGYDVTFVPILEGSRIRNQIF